MLDSSTCGWPYKQRPLALLSNVCHRIELVWRREFDRHFQGSRSHAPIPYNDCVVIVLGWDSETRSSGEIASLRKKDGEITWSRVFEGHPSTCELIGDRLYIEEAGRLWVLDASSGEKLPAVPSDFLLLRLVFYGRKAPAYSRSLDGWCVSSRWMAGSYFRSGRFLIHMSSS